MKGISIDNLLSQRDLRRFEVGGRTRFAAVDVLAILTDSQRPAELWHDLKVREPSLARWVETLDDGVEVVDLDGLLRLVQAVPSANAERVKWWLAESGRRRIEETEHPELSALRTRRIYERRGYPRRWIEKRVRGVSSRHELTAEWYKRGVRNSEEFRVLTNTLSSVPSGWMCGTIADPRVWRDPGRRCGTA